MMSLYYLILWNQVDILQKHFKKDHVHMRLWTRFYGIGFFYPFQTGLLPCSPQTRIWGEQWMTFLGNPYVNTRCGQYALSSYRLLISAYVTVATCLG